MQLARADSKSLPFTEGSLSNLVGVNPYVLTTDSFYMKKVKDRTGGQINLFLPAVSGAREELAEDRSWCEVAEKEVYLDHNSQNMDIVYR